MITHKNPLGGFPMFLSLILLTACQGAEEKNPQEVFYKNQTLEITLEENPTTGYLWYLEDTPEEMLLLVQEDYEPSSSDESLIGGGAFITFILPVQRKEMSQYPSSTIVPGKGQRALQIPAFFM